MFRKYNVTMLTPSPIYVIVAIMLLWPSLCISQSWQETLGRHFDIVETFDGLQDWRGTMIHGYDQEKANQVKRIDGSDSMWDMYDNWSYVAPTEDWIKNHGASNVWRGEGKSLRMDIDQSSDVAKKGPSRFGLYFGSSTAGQADAYATSGVSDSGYKDIYYFYMVKLPNNVFPAVDGGIWPESIYKWWSYHKFATMCAGFSDIDSPSGIGGCRWEYGCSYILTELKMCGSSCDTAFNSTVAPSHDIRIVDSYLSDQTWVQGDVVIKDGLAEDYINLQMAGERWWAIEYHVSMGTPGQYDGAIQTWIYDDNGTAKLVTDRSGIMVTQAGTDIAYNKFFFGGNISYQPDVDAQGLLVSYFVDDLVIDNQRIGPLYFQILAGTNDTEAPAAPSNLRSVQ